MSAAAVRIPEFGPAVVRALRTELALTQEQLANIAGVHRRTIVNFERGRHTATAPTLDAIRGALSRRAEQLARRSARR